MDREKALSILDHLWTFTDERCYMLVAIARSKENDEVRATDQPVMRKVVEDREELEDKLDQLSHATKRFPQSYRLYATVNGRNAREALHFLQKEALDLLRQREKSGQTTPTLKRIDHEWKSILHQPRCRDEKRFLWDIDDASPEACSAIEASLNSAAEVVLTQETPNGWHIVTAPFNFNDIEGYDPEQGTFRGFECEHKSDDMVYLGFL